MRKQFAAILIASILAIMLPVAASSQTKYSSAKNRDHRGKNTQSRVYNDERYAYDDRYYGYEKPGFYDRNHKIINVAVTTGAGAAIGAVAAGKKGALVGAAAGVVTGLIINAKQKPKNYPYRY